MEQSRQHGRAPSHARRGRRSGRVRRILTRLVAVLFVFCLLVVTYGVAVEPRFVLDTERIEARLPALGQDWAGADVAVFSDLQVGMWLDNVGMIEQIVAQTVAAEPDVVLLAGDFVYGAEDALAPEVDTIVDLLEPLVDAGLPVYAVMGNHDYAVGAVDELTAAFEQMGITVLSNEAAALPAPGSRPGPGLFVVGVGPEFSDEARPAPALDDVPDAAPRLVLMHNPTTFPELPPSSAPLTLAGHTHCGQIAVPLLSRWSYLGLTEEEELVADGFAPPGYGAEGNRMYVTCGIGFSLLPMRINAPPQLVVVELLPA